MPTAADPAPPATDAAPPPAAAKRKKKPKKTLVPLPTLEAASDWLPFKLAFTQRLGRHAVAAKALAPGDLILAETPVAAVPRARHAGRACPGCAVGVCGGGGKYCGPACKAQHAAVRAAAAPGRAAVAAAGVKHGAPASSADGLDGEDLADLLALAVELDAAKAVEEGRVGGDKRHVHTGACAHAHARAHGDDADACGHGHGASDLGESAVDPRFPLRCGAADVAALARGWAQRPAAWRAQLTAAAGDVAAAIAEAAPYTHTPTAASLADIADVVGTNAHGTGAGDPSSADLGFGLFPALATLNHSCAPNCAFAVTGGVARARATRAIAAGEPLTLAYVNLYEPRATRRAQLAAAKHFVCACECCTPPLVSARDRRLQGVPCKARGGACGGALLPTNDGGAGADWSCDACGRSVPARTPAGTGPADVTDRAALALDSALATLHTKGPAAAAPSLAAIVDLAPSTLCAEHVVVFDALMPLANAARHAKDTATAARCVGSLITAMDSLVGIPTAELGNLLELHADLLASRADAAPAALAARLARAAADAAARGAEVRALVLGGAHPLTEVSKEQAARLKRG